MSRHFGPQHIRNGYSAMGSSLRRPIYGGVNAQRTVAESIAAERNKAARMAAAAKKKK